MFYMGSRCLRRGNGWASSFAKEALGDLCIPHEEQQYTPID